MLTPGTSFSGPHLPVQLLSRDQVMLHSRAVVRIHCPTHGVQVLLLLPILSPSVSHAIRFANLMDMKWYHIVVCISISMIKGCIIGKYIGQSVSASLNPY